MEFLLLLVAQFCMEMIEAAFLAANHVKLRHQAVGTAGEACFEYFHNNSERVIAVLVIIEVSLSSALIAVATLWAQMTFGSYMVGLAVGGVTLLSVLFGQIVPKTLGKAHSQEILLRVARPLRAVVAVLFPLAWVFQFVSGLFSSLWRRAPSFGRDDIETMVEIGEEEGVIDEDEGDVIGNILGLDRVGISSVMIPRAQIVGVDSAMTLDEVVRLFNEEGYSRLPVYSGDIDRIRGYLYQKDVLRMALDERRTSDLSELVRSVLFFPQGNDVLDAFKEMQREKCHIAIVVDEHGGTAGMVTMEDILEEMFGQIHDESDGRSDQPFIEEGGVTSVDPSVSLREFNDVFGTSLSSRGSETVAGLIQEMLGRVPRDGDILVMPGVTIRIVEVQDRVVSRIYVERRVAEAP